MLLSILMILFLPVLFYSEIKEYWKARRKKKTIKDELKNYSEWTEMYEECNRVFQKESKI